MTAPATVARSTDYGALLKTVRRDGLLERSAVGYLPRLLVLAAAAGAGVVMLVAAGHSWWELAVAAYFGLISAQLGFLGHDAGHQQIFRTNRWNNRAGALLSTLGVGLSYQWWVDKHNRHHHSPNEVGRDPDVERNILAWTDQQASAQRGVARVVARHQAGLFFPLLLLEGWNLHVGSVRALLGRLDRGRLELLGLVVHVAATVTVLLLLLSPLQALAFVAVQQSVFGLYLGSVFAPNHKGMAMPRSGNRLDFLRRQVLTSRNVVGGRLLTAAFGGLNYQIEHHLFPSMPSRNLRRCRALVKDFCANHDVSYTEATLIRSYAEALRHLRSVGLRPAAAEPVAAS